MSTIRAVAGGASVVAVVALFLLYNPWLVPPDSVTPALTLIFWIAAIVLLGALYGGRNEPGAEVVEVEGPRFTRFLFGNTRAGLFWLPIRVFLGLEWLLAGYEKLTGKGWIDGGSALLGYWKFAVSIPQTGRPPISYDWYRSFLQFLIDHNSQGWFAWLITVGEIAVGLGLIVGALCGVAAFFGATMNMSYMLAGSASTNPVMFALAIGVMLAWRIAGYYGVDRYLLPLLGTPRRPPETVSATPAAAPTS